MVYTSEKSLKSGIEELDPTKVYDPVINDRRVKKAMSSLHPISNSRAFFQANPFESLSPTVIYDLVFPPPSFPSPVVLFVVFY